MFGVASSGNSVTGGTGGDGGNNNGNVATGGNQSGCRNRCYGGIATGDNGNGGNGGSATGGMLHSAHSIKPVHSNSNKVDVNICS